MIYSSLYASESLVVYKQNLIQQENVYYKNKLDCLFQNFKETSEIDYCIENVDLNNTLTLQKQVYVEPNKKILDAKFLNTSLDESYSKALKCIDVSHAKYEVKHQCLNLIINNSKSGIIHSDSSEINNSQLVAKNIKFEPADTAYKKMAVDIASILHKTKLLCEQLEPLFGRECLNEANIDFIGLSGDSLEDFLEESKKRYLSMDKKYKQKSLLNAYKQKIKAKLMCEQKTKIKCIKSSINTAKVHNYCLDRNFIANQCRETYK